MNRFQKIVISLAGIPLVPVMALWTHSTPRRRFPSDAEPVFLYSQVIWDEVWQRPQQYAWHASTNRPVVHCCPIQLHNLPTIWKRWKPVKYETRGGRMLTIVSPLVFSGHFKSRWIFNLNCRIIAYCLRSHTPGITSPVPPLYINFIPFYLFGEANTGGTLPRVLANTPFAVPVLRRLFHPNRSTAPQWKRLVYDVIDDFPAFDWAPPFARDLDRELINLSDAIITGTFQLSQKYPGSRFIPCGVDFKQFASPEALPPDDIRKLNGPVIGYFGTISERIDLHLIAAIADRFPSASVVMIGPVHFDARDLPRRPNLHYLGLKPHDDLPSYARAFDVGLIPFRITPATVHLNPVKTLEYLAAGVPVVSTAIPDIVRFYSGIVRTASTPAEFLDKLAATLESPDPAMIEHGIQVARSASWKGMTEQVNHTLFDAATAPSSNVPREASARS